MLLTQVGQAHCAQLYYDSRIIKMLSFLCIFLGPDCSLLIVQSNFQDLDPLLSLRSLDHHQLPPWASKYIFVEYKIIRGEKSFLIICGPNFQQYKHIKIVSIRFMSVHEFALYANLYAGYNSKYINQIFISIDRFNDCIGIGCKK